MVEVKDAKIALLIDVSQTAVYVIVINDSLDWILLDFSLLWNYVMREIYFCYSNGVVLKSNSLPMYFICNSYRLLTN